jgi:predicted transcriptional regulator
MNHEETLAGRPVTSEEIDRWVEEAERGYDPETLKRKKGRPGRGADPSHVVTLRLTDEELRHIDEQASRAGLTRSDLIRRALGELLL